MTPYRHIIWDWNGTLVDDAWLCVEILNDLLRQNNMKSVTLQEYRDMFEFPVINYYQKIGFDVSSGSFEKIADHFFSAFDERFSECVLRKDAPETITAISQRGVRHFILSATEHNTLLNMVAERFKPGLFSDIQGIKERNAAGKIEEGKAFLNRLNIAPESILLIGDTTHDYQVATALGVDCVLLAGGHQSKERLSSVGTQVADSMQDIADMFA